MTGNSDPYVYPRTTVLKNLRDIRDPQALARFEAEAARRRLQELGSRPVAGRFDAKHLQAIHRHIFQDVYPWAGGFRTINIARAGQFPFAFPHQIARNISRIADGLKHEQYLKGLGAKEFAGRAAHYLGELNAIHPFREGNGRTQREFIRQLAEQAGHQLEWQRVDARQFHEASRVSFQRGDNSGLKASIRTAISGPAPEKNRASPDLDEALKQRVARKKQERERDQEGGRGTRER